MEPTRFVIEGARTPPMASVVALARRAARTTASVLITGESGTGKRALARWIHEAGGRAGGPLIHLGRAAVTAAALIEAARDRVHRGVFADAAGGTLVIDEVGELPSEAQAALLQLLDLAALRAVGAHGTRVIATSRHPATSLRADLYYALGVIAIAMPPLRQRTGDIPGLVSAILARSSPPGRRGVQISEAAVAWLTHAPWPGNVRELETTIERAIALCESNVIEIADLVAPRQPDQAGPPSTSIVPPLK
jgi:DNA-binding NtrC family response regulator